MIALVLKQFGQEDIKSVFCILYSVHAFLREVKSILLGSWSIYKLKVTGKTTFNDHPKFQYHTG